MPLFSKSSNFSINDGSFTDIVTQNITTINVNEQQSSFERPGLKALLDKSIPGAAHDSSDRHPPPLCHPGTRDELIEQLVIWGVSHPDHHSEYIAWARGPAGSGKSAICQSSANSYGDQLAASFFFSRPNRRSDPKRFFTTIAYQLAVKYEGFGKLLDEKIRRDPTIMEKSLPIQFQELIAAPFNTALTSGETFAGKVIIVDGLDECEGARSQQEILDIIAQSVIDKTTPFRWIIASRLEPHIVSKFNNPDINNLTFWVEVTISRDLDPKIFRFLADRLVEIRRKHGLGESWPREEDLHTLVELSSGMFAYAHVISLFIDDPNSTSPMSQLRLVLALAERRKTEKGSRHPLAELDAFYTTLILECLPPKKCKAVRLILLSHYLLAPRADYPTRLPITFGSFTNARASANLFGYSEEEFRLLCQSFHAVMFINPASVIYFYHASFMDFLLDSTRSGRFCIQADDCLLELYDHVKQTLDNLRQDDDSIPSASLSWGTPSRNSHAEQYYCLATVFTKVLIAALCFDALGEQRLAALSSFDFGKVTWLGGLHTRWHTDDPRAIYDCLMAQSNGLVAQLNFRGILFERSTLHSGTTVKRDRPNHKFFLGYGKNAVRVHYHESVNSTVMIFLPLNPSNRTARWRQWRWDW